MRFAMIIVFALFPCLMLLGVAGCEPSGPAAAPSTTVPPGGAAALPDRSTLGGVAPSARDTLLLAYGSDPNTLNAITSSDTVSGAFQRQVYESLAQADFSDPDNLLPPLDLLPRRRRRTK